MATSGSASVAVTSYDTMTVSWTLNSQSTTNNTSNITFTATLTSTAYGKISSSSSKDYSATINGTTYTGTNTVGIAASSTLTLFSKTLTITHGSDGSCSFTFSFTQTFGITFNGTSITTATASCTVTPTSIARASSITSAAAVTLGNACSIKWTPASSSYAYKLKFTVNGYSYTTGYISPATTSAYTYTGYTMAIATWAPYITTSTSASCSVTLYTYTSSSSTTSIGSSSTAFAVTVPTSCKPSVSISCAEGNSAVTIGVYVQNKSKVTVTSTGTTSYGAAIKSYAVTVGSKSYSGSSITSDTLTSSGSVTISCTVTDTRGRTGTASTTITVYAYSAPSISKFTVVRCDSSGTAASDGTYAKVTYTYSISSCNSKNTASMAIKSKLTTAASYTSKKTSTSTSASAATAILSTYDTESSYNFQMTVTDAFSTTTKNILLSTAAVIMDVLASGDGVAFGKVAEKSGYLDIAWKTLFNAAAYFVNGGIIYGYDTSGAAYQVFQAMSNSDNTAIGYGHYTNANGNLNLYGNDVMIFSAAAGNSNFRPYWRAGLSTTFTLYTAGYITNSGTQVVFSIPLALYTLGSPTVTLASGNGFIIRQNGSYTHGSAASAYAVPDSYAVTRTNGFGVTRVVATFSDTTNAVNNTPCGIMWNGTITFS